MYKFNFNEKEYELNDEKCVAFFNDEERKVKEVNLNKILEILNKAENIEFSREYYGSYCEECLNGKEEKAKEFSFLEYHFYIFTKNDTYIVSSISPEYESNTYGNLVKIRKVDNSYIVSIIVCEKCGAFTVEIEQCEM
ncbi:Protein of unknown function [Clostridium cavendishii DSM 21758]|uniref:DUF3785 domain-containing protein n=1 Tax=Clostridium cavendishii DSM 21758 TaxID=1121302 RepID=A0A1M6ICG5_9CLOT|nr:DUF3785 family protein [Clostridium cavendishii]SHJ32097.1 Protein of unknown function [Clostridium cavendishii DSM 21758]